ERTGAPCPNTEDDQGLRDHRFDEPARLKQALTGVKYAQHDPEGYEIEDGADWTENHHEAFNQLDIPLQWLDHRFRIDVVERYRVLGNVVDQVVEQDLDRQHRQERQDQRGAGHAEHVAEVRARAHQHIFGHVLDRGAPARDGVTNHREIRFEENQIGCRASDVGRALDGDSDVGRVQRRRVVDAVPHESHDIAAPLQRQQDSMFLLRIYPAK